MIPHEALVIRGPAEMGAAIDNGTLDKLDLIRINLKDGTHHFGNLSLMDVDKGTFKARVGDLVRMTGAYMASAADVPTTFTFDQVDCVIVDRQRDIFEHFEGCSTRATPSVLVPH